MTRLTIENDNKITTVKFGDFIPCAVISYNYIGANRLSPLVYCIAKIYRDVELEDSPVLLSILISGIAL